MLLIDVPINIGINFFVFRVIFFLHQPQLGTTILAISTYIFSYRVASKFLENIISVVRR